MKQSIRGFSLIEALVTISIVGIVAALALPSLSSSITNNAVKSVTQELVSEMALARTQAMKNNANVEFTFTTGSNWCIGIDYDSPYSCSCSTASTCTKVIDSSNYSSLSLTNNLIDSSANSASKILFTPNRGRLKDGSGEGVSGSIDFQRSSKTIKVKVNILGKGFTCSDDIAGLGACS